MNGADKSEQEPDPKRQLTEHQPHGVLEEGRIYFFYRSVPELLTPVHMPQGNQRSGHAMLFSGTLHMSGYELCRDC